MDIVITTAGLQAIVCSQQTGTNAVTICHVGIGRGKYTATKSQTALQDEIKKLPVIEGGRTGDNAIHVAVQDNSTDSYPVHEFGLFLEDGTLFAVYSQQTAILQKLATSNALISFDIMLEGANADQIDFGEISYTFAAATTENAGIIEIATDEEVQALECKQRAITPCGLKSLTATENRAGIIRVATEEEAKAGTGKNAVIVPATLRAATVSCAASDTETLDGKLANKFVTPVSLRAVEASTSRNGLVELATESETIKGADSKRAVTPSGLKAAIDKAIPPGTEDAKGMIQFATNVEASTGLLDNKAVHPAGLKATIDSRAAVVSEVTNGTADGKFVTPFGLRTQVGSEAEVKKGESKTKLVTAATAKAAVDARAATTEEVEAGTLADKFVTPHSLKNGYKFSSGITFIHGADSEYILTGSGTKLDISLQMTLSRSIDDTGTRTDIFTVYVNNIDVGKVYLVWTTVRSGGSGFGRTITTTLTNSGTLSHAITAGDSVRISRTTNAIGGSIHSINAIVQVR